MLKHLLTSFTVEFHMVQMCHDQWSMSYQQRLKVRPLFNKVLTLHWILGPFCKKLKERHVSFVRFFRQSFCYFANQGVAKFLVTDIKIS